jgi:flagellar biogenesis protein FliO
MQQIITVLAVMALMIGMLQWLRRRGVAHLRTGFVRRKAGRRLELLERLPLTPQHSLHIVRMDGRSLLIGVSPSGCALLENGKTELDRGECT